MITKEERLALDRRVLQKKEQDQKDKIENIIKDIKRLISCYKTKEDYTITCGPDFLQCDLQDISLESIKFFCYKNKFKYCLGGFLFADKIYTNTSYYPFWDRWDHKMLLKKYPEVKEYLDNNC